MTSSIKKTGLDIRSAFFEKTSFSPASCLDTNTGTPCFMIPAFSPAISSFVFPRYFVCSSSIGVIIQHSGVRTFVASSLPPIPVSKTAHGNPAVLNVSMANAVTSSNHDGAFPPGTNAGTMESTLGIRKSAARP